MPNKQVLIVDDDFSVRISLKMIIKDCGCDMDEAENGEEALKRVSEKAYDIVLLDVFMPKMTGVQLLMALKKPKGVKPYIYIISAYNNLEEVQKALEYSDGCIQKPFNVQEIKNVMERSYP